MIPTIRIPPETHIYRKAHWVKALRNNLKSLERFKLAKVIEDESVPKSSHAKTTRHEHSIFVKVNDKLIWIDTWDFHAPGYEWLSGKGADIDVACILKIQCSGKKFKDERKIPIFPWTMFHMCHTRWLDNLNDFRKMYKETPREHWLGFSGRMWGWRKKWQIEMESMDYTQFIGYGRTPPGDFIEYVKKMVKWRVGLSIIGKRDRLTDGKNRREVEYASVGMPMILNYRPHYFNQLIPGSHYLYCAKPEHLGKMMDNLMDDKELYDNLSHNSLSWWEANASEKGICETFIQIMLKAGVL